MKKRWLVQTFKSAALKMQWKNLRQPPECRLLVITVCANTKHFNKLLAPSVMITSTYNSTTGRVGGRRSLISQENATAVVHVGPNDATCMTAHLFFQCILGCTYVDVYSIVDDQTKET